MPRMLRASWMLMSVFYVLAGANHFARPGFYLPMMPPYLPWPLALIYLSGAAECLLGLALWAPGLRRWASWGLIALLAAVFPANLHMCRVGGAAFGVPQWFLYARLPLQGLLIAWAYAHAKAPGACAKPAGGLS